MYLEPWNTPLNNSWEMSFFQQMWSAGNLLRTPSLFPRPSLADVQHCEFSSSELRVNKCFSNLRPSRRDLFDHLKCHSFSFSLLHLNLTAKIGELEHKLRSILHRADFHDECHKDAELFLKLSDNPQVLVSFNGLILASHKSESLYF